MRRRIAVVFLAPIVITALPTPETIDPHALGADTVVRCFDTYAFHSSNGSKDWTAQIRCSAVYDEDHADLGDENEDGNDEDKRGLDIVKAIIPGAESRLNVTTNLFRYEPNQDKDIYIQFIGSVQGNSSVGTQQLLGRTNKDGEVERELAVPDKAISPVADTKAGYPLAQFQIKYPQGVNREASRGHIMIPSTTPPFGVFSDIDDTIKITQVLDMQQMLQNAFAKEYKPVPGMPELFRRIHDSFPVPSNGSDIDIGRPVPLFYYVSGTPWQLIDVLSQFIDQYYPMGEFMLQKFRFSVGSLIRFSNIRKYKTGRFDLIHKRFPELRWYLIGDSGQLDPEIYAEIYKRYPDRIICIWIVKTQGTDVEKERKQNADSRFQKAFKEVPSDKWNAFHEPATIMQLPEGKCR